MQDNREKLKSAFLDNRQADASDSEEEVAEGDIDEEEQDEVEGGEILTDYLTPMRTTELKRKNLVGGSLSERTRSRTRSNYSETDGFGTPQTSGEANITQ